jgi:hypothetical protein
VSLWLEFHPSLCCYWRSSPQVSFGLKSFPSVSPVSISLCGTVTGTGYLVWKAEDPAISIDKAPSGTTGAKILVYKCYFWFL